MIKNDIKLIYLQINKKIAYSSKQMLFLAVIETLESSEFKSSIYFASYYLVD